MKNRLRVTSILFAITAILVFGRGSAAAPQDLAGRWEGTLDLLGTKLAVDLDIAKKADGAWTGDISIPAQGAKDLPLEGIKIEGADVTFAIAGVPGNPTFRGQISADGATITGKMTQGAGAFPFELKRGEDPVAKVRKTLEGFDELVAKGLAQLKVPGAAVAVVKDREVILAKGFGFRDVEGKLPMTADTLLAIGSSPAFTAYTLGTSSTKADRGGEPVRTYIPGSASTTPARRA
jgi:hypothetical protein